MESSFLYQKATGIAVTDDVTGGLVLEFISWHSFPNVG